MRIDKNEENQDKESSFYKTSKYDIILIAFIVFFSLVFMLRINQGRFKQASGSGIALIYQKDKLLEKVGLKKDGIVNILDGQMQIEVKKGKIRVIKADCPQHVCINMGWIQYSGQTIVCVPNKVIIEIASKGSPLLDAVVY